MYKVYSVTNIIYHSLLTVPPTVLANPPEILGLVGSDETLEFTITRAFPQVLPQDIILTFNNNSDISEDISDMAYINGSLVILNITDIQNENEGLYTVVASNPAGSDRANITLKVQGNVAVLMITIILLIPNL